MTTTDKLLLMKEIEQRNTERWSISAQQQNDRQTAIEYSAREYMMGLYIR